MKNISLAGLSLAISVFMYCSEEKADYTQHQTTSTAFIRAHALGSHIVAAATKTDIALYLFTTTADNIKLTHLQTSDDKPAVRVTLDKPLIKNFVINKHDSRQLALAQQLEENPALSNLCLYEGAWEKFRSVTPQFESVEDLCFLPDSSNLYTVVTTDDGTVQLTTMNPDDLAFIPLDDLHPEQGTRLAAATRQALAYSTRSGPHYFETIAGTIKRKLPFTEVINDQDTRPIPLDITSDETCIVSTNRKKVFIFDPRTNQPKILTDDNLDITNLAFLDDTHLLLQSSHPENTFTAIYDQRKGGHLQDVTATFDYASLIQNGRLILSGHNKPMVLLQK